MNRFGIVVSFLFLFSFTQISCIAAMGLCPRFVSKIRSLIKKLKIASKMHKFASISTIYLQNRKNSILKAVLG